MTRAKDSLTLWQPQRFHVTQQRHWVERHLYAPRTRFITDDDSFTSPQTWRQGRPLPRPEALQRLTRRHPRST